MTLTVTKFRPSMSAFLSEHGVKAVPGDGWQSCVCPFHNDDTASASFNEGEGIFRCHACGVKGDVAQILLQVDGLSFEEVNRRVEAMPKAQAATPLPQKRGATGPALALIIEAAKRYHAMLFREEGDRARAYLQERGFTAEMAEEQMLGVVEDPYPGHEAYVGRLAIPYITTSGVVDIRFRCLKDHNCKDHGCPKYLGLPGSPTRMYDARRVMDPGNVIAVCEGELDACVMTHVVGIPAVAVPGVQNWKAHYSLVLSGFDLVLVLGDGDEAGRKFSRSVAPLTDNGVEIPMPNGHDVNSLVLEQGPESVRSICNLLK